MLEPVPQRAPAAGDAGEESAVLAVPHRFLQEAAPVTHEPVAPLARHGAVQEREGDGRASRVFEALVVRPDRAPPVIEVDEKASIPPVDAARKEWLQHMTPQGVSRLLRVYTVRTALRHGRRGRRAPGSRLTMRGVIRSDPARG